MNVDGSGLERITNDPGRDIHPYFSPDGKYLLYTTTRINGSFDIMRYDFDTKATNILSKTIENETCARYSPDMRSIVYLQNRDTIDDIFVADILNQKVVGITNTPDIDGRALKSKSTLNTYHLGGLRDQYFLNGFTSELHPLIQSENPDALSHDHGYDSLVSGYQR